MTQTMSSGPAERLWTRQFALATAVNALVMTIFYLLMTTMAVYATEQFGASATAAGLASSMYIVGAVGARLVGGRLVETAGPRRTLLASLLVFVVMSLVYLPADGLGLLLAVRFVHGAAYGVGHTAVTTLAQSAIPPGRRGEGTGYFTLGVPVAGGVGPLLALWLVGRWDYDVLFLACAAVSASAWAMAVLMSEGAPGPRRRDARPLLRELVHPHVLPVATFMLLVGVANAAIITYVHPYAEALGLAGAAGAFFLVQAVAVLAARTFAGRVQDRHGDNAVLYPALAVYAAGMVVLSQAGSTAALMVAGVLAGLGFGTLMPAAQAAAVRIADGERVGLAVSTYYLFLDAGTGLGPLALGLVIGAADHRVMYLTVAALVIVSAGHYHAVHGRRARLAARA
ncbi:putative MFS family arabinose efflux permease [Georgenia soli]|uniref:Putative MFS family arabinose efflux permease n=1 Tax=Georgenia soli TaxID=638953 RepID=A0A2A9EIM6_9MICO|nr:MFS transporter [Georgenia soli]PFG38105.1 putative MFS family arabinose efflux permease [Georgenia soli]